MRWLVDVTIGAMLDARSRRAIEETLLDWSHEAQEVKGPLSALQCHLRAVLAIIRTIAAIIGHELAELPKCAVWLRAGLFLVASYVFFQIWFRPLLPGDVSATTRLMLSLMLFPGWLLGYGAMALFLAAVWRPRSDRPKTPFLGLATVSLVVAFVNAGWVMPAGNQEYRETAFQLHGRRGSLPRGVHELTLPELLASDTSGSQRGQQKHLHRRLAFVAACPVFILLAGQLQVIRRRYRWVAVSVVALFAGAGMKLGPGPPSSEWLLLVGAMVGGIVIGILRRSRFGTLPVDPSG